MNDLYILLVSPEAEALAARLEASGYACGTEVQLGVGSGQGTDASPDAVLLSADQAGRISALRQHWGTIPLLLDVGTDTVEARIHCLSSGADDFWLSSLGPSDLLMRLRLHLDLARRANVPAQLQQVGDLVVNPSTRQVKRGPRPVYVRYLRQKLEEGGERRLIHTIRGQGYCLSERLPQLEARE